LSLKKPQRAPGQPATVFPPKIVPGARRIDGESYVARGRLRSAYVRSRIVAVSRKMSARGVQDSRIGLKIDFRRGPRRG